VVWGLVKRANEAQRTSLLYAARSIAAGVDAELGKYVAGRRARTSQCLERAAVSARFAFVLSTVERWSVSCRSRNSGGPVSIGLPGSVEMSLGSSDEKRREAIEAARVCP
jgi:hypothetical protein